MKCKTRLVSLIILIVSVMLTACGEEYDSSIHDGKVAEINSNRDLTKYINYYKPLGINDIMIIKSDDRKKTEYTDGKVYEYTIIIDVNNSFINASETDQFGFMNKVANVFEDTIAGEGTSFIGIYDMVIVTSRDNDPDYGVSMRIHGIRKLVY